MIALKQNLDEKTGTITLFRRRSLNLFDQAWGWLKNDFHIFFMNFSLMSAGHFSLKPLRTGCCCRTWKSAFSFSLHFMSSKWIITMQLRTFCLFFQLLWSFVKNYLFVNSLSSCIEQWLMANHYIITWYLYVLEWAISVVKGDFSYG